MVNAVCPPSASSRPKSGKKTVPPAVSDGKETIVHNLSQQHCAHRGRPHFHARRLQGHPYGDAVAIVMVRNPYDWAFAMWRNCWWVNSGSVK
jgi:hypothetical protein